MAHVHSGYKWAAILIALLTVVISACTPAAPPSTPVEQPVNQPPKIQYISAPSEVSPSTISQLKCVATDADNDTLTYTWTATGGTIAGMVDTVDWTAPDAEGTYTINVSVSDGNGGEDKQSADVVVKAKPNASPVLNIVVTLEDKSEHVVKPNDTAAIWMRLWSTAAIKCTATDPEGDAVSFLWAASSGKIEGEGGIVNYIATERGDFIIIVTAIDSQGAVTKGNIYIHVPCCGQGSFGKSD